MKKVKAVTLYIIGSTENTRGRYMFFVFILQVLNNGVFIDVRERRRANAQK